MIIVVLCDAREADVPNELAAGLPSFVIPQIDERNLENLLRRLTGQPAYVRRETGRVPILPPAIDGPGKPGNLEQRIEHLDVSIRDDAGRRTERS